MTNLSSILRKLLLVFALLNILMCPLLFIGGTFFPRALFFGIRFCVLRACIWTRRWNLRLICGAASRLQMPFAQTITNR